MLVKVCDIVFLFCPEAHSDAHVIPELEAAPKFPSCVDSGVRQQMEADCPFDIGCNASHLCRTIFSANSTASRRGPCRCHRHFQPRETLRPTHVPESLQAIRRNRPLGNIYFFSWAASCIH